MANEATLLLLALAGCSHAVALPEAAQFCIVGAGPGGLQLGHYLHRRQRDYLVIERSDKPGAFFRRYPRHRKLISLNKRFTGRVDKEFNLRHDWNSLLDHDEVPPMTARSHERFPPADVLTAYLEEFGEAQRDRILYRTSVERVDRRGAGKFELLLDREGEPAVLRCQVVIMASGLWEPQTESALVSGMEHVVGYEELPTDGESFQEQTVLVLGIGNSGLETVDALAPWANYVHVVNPRAEETHTLTPSWETRYVGNPRAINAAVLDSYLLKSLDGGLGTPFPKQKLALFACSYAGQDSLEDHGRLARDALRPGGRSERVCVLPTDFDDVVTLGVDSEVMERAWAKELLERLGTRAVVGPGRARPQNLRMYRVPARTQSLSELQVGGTFTVVRISRWNISSEEEVHGLMRLASTIGSPNPLVYDTVVRCLGWRHNVSIYGNAARPFLQPNRKYAAMNSEYESVNINGLFFAGTLAHGKDFKRSAGGFIHGFRYTARALFRILERKYNDEPWPAVQFGVSNVSSIAAAASWMLRRINTASGPYQMVGVLGDGLLLLANGSMVGLQEIPGEYFHEQYKNFSRIFWHFGYYSQRQSLAESIAGGTKFEIHIWHATPADRSREMIRLVETFQTDWDNVANRRAIQAFLADKASAAAKKPASKEVQAWHSSIREMARQTQKISKATWTAGEVDLYVVNHLESRVELRRETEQTSRNGWMATIGIDPGESRVLTAHHGDRWVGTAAGQPRSSYSVDLANGKVQDFVIGSISPLEGQCMGVEADQC